MGERLDIKVGDTVDINTSLRAGREEILQRIFNVQNKSKIKQFPFKVETIEPCDSMYDGYSEECDTCPGLINGECFGYSEGYVLLKVSEWDNENN